MQQKKEKDWIVGLLNVVISLIIPSLAYLFTYMYMAGFFYRFKLPMEFIEINFVNIIISFLYIILFVVLAYFLYEIFYTLGIIKKYKLIIITLLSIFHLGLLLILKFILEINWIIASIVALFFLLFDFFALIYPRLRTKDIADTEKKIEQFKKHSIVFKTFLSKLYEKNQLIYKLTVLAMTGLILSFVLGSLNARLSKTFLVIKSNPELVVLQKCSDKLLCKTFVRQKKEIQNNIYIKSLDQLADEQVELIYEKIGPLNVSKASDIEEK